MHCEERDPWVVRFIPVQDHVIQGQSCSNKNTVSTNTTLNIARSFPSVVECI